MKDLLDELKHKIDNELAIYCIRRLYMLEQIRGLSRLVCEGSLFEEEILSMIDLVVNTRVEIMPDEITTLLETKDPVFVDVAYEIMSDTVVQDIIEATDSISLIKELKSRGLL